MDGLSWLIKYLAERKRHRPQHRDQVPPMSFRQGTQEKIAGLSANMRGPFGGSASGERVQKSISRRMVQLDCIPFHPSRARRPGFGLHTSNSSLQGQAKV